MQKYKKCFDWKGFKMISAYLFHLYIICFLIDSRNPQEVAKNGLLP